MPGYRQSKHKTLKKYSIVFVFFLIVILQMSGLNCSFAATDSAQAHFTPWSGYWWPTVGGGLSTGIGYRGHPAPIAKYEMLKDGILSGLGPAASWDTEHHYDPEALRWYGLCHAWSAASVSENIEFYPSSIENIIFYVGDKKGLLTACHEHDVSIRVNSHSPEVLHMWLLQYIKEQGLSFYGELEPGQEVWNYPIYKYEMDLVDNGDSLDVTCTIWYADDMVEPDYMGTKSLTATYTYRLFKSGEEITGGEWTGISFYDHPEQLIMPVSQHTENPYLDYNFIREIATSKDDYLESDLPVELYPGGYNLILLNMDVYTVSCAKGDSIILGIKKIDDLEEAIHYDVLDSQSEIVFSGLIENDVNLNFSAENPPYTIKLYRMDYGKGGVYRIDCDQINRFEFVNSKIQKGYQWGGICITNTGAERCDNVFLTGYRYDGTPIETLSGPYSLDTGEKKIIFYSDLICRNIEINDLVGIRVHHSQKPLSIVNLSGYYGRNMISINGMEKRSRLIIPDSTSKWNMSRSVSWGVFNSSHESMPVEMRLYSMSGEEKDQLSTNFSADETLYFGGNQPFSDEIDDGWIMIESQTTPELKGYIEWRKNGISKTGNLRPLNEGTVFYVPHSTKNDFWDMEIIIICTEDAQNQVSFNLINGTIMVEKLFMLAPFEKRRFSINEIFLGTSDEDISASALMIKSSKNSAGYYIFETPADDVFYPLLGVNDFKSELTLSYVVSNSAWWTAVNLFNIGDEQTEYEILPYDENGVLMAEKKIDCILNPLTKDVFTIETKFGDDAQNISFIKFSVTAGPGIGGIFGYGNPECTMLSGGVL